MSESRALAVPSAPASPAALALSELPAAPIDARRMPATAQHWTTLRSLEAIDGFTRLVPAEVCERVIVEVEESLAALSSPAQAVALGKRLVGSYPRRELADPTTFAATLARTFGRFPADLGEMAVDHIVERLRFFPTVADVATVLRELAAARKVVARRARMHLAEHARRAEEAERRQLIEADRRRAAEVAAAARLAQRAEASADRPRQDRGAPVALAEIFRGGVSRGFAEVEVEEARR